MIPGNTLVYVGVYTQISIAFRVHQDYFVTCAILYASVAIAHLGLYTSDSGLGQWVNIVHETVCGQWFGVG